MWWWHIQPHKWCTYRHIYCMSYITCQYVLSPSCMCLNVVLCCRSLWGSGHSLESSVLWWPVPLSGPWSLPACFPCAWPLCTRLNSLITDLWTSHCDVSLRTAELSDVWSISSISVRGEPHNSPAPPNLPTISEEPPVWDRRLWERAKRLRDHYCVYFHMSFRLTVDAVWSSTSDVKPPHWPKDKHVFIVLSKRKNWVKNSQWKFWRKLIHILDELIKLYFTLYLTCLCHV